MYDVPSIALFCSESIECFPGIASKCFLKRLVSISVGPIITGTIVHFRLHFPCIIIIIIIIIIVIEFLTSQLWLENIHLSWDVVINRIKLSGLIYGLKSFLQL